MPYYFRLRHFRRVRDTLRRRLTFSAGVFRARPAGLHIASGIRQCPSFSAVHVTLLSGGALHFLAFVFGLGPRFCILPRAFCFGTFAARPFDKSSARPARPFRKIPTVIFGPGPRGPRLRATGFKFGPSIVLCPGRFGGEQPAWHWLPRHAGGVPAAIRSSSGRDLF